MSHDKINHQLELVIDSLDPQPSFFTKLSRGWMKLPLWSRFFTVVGIAAIGVVAHLWIAAAVFTFSFACLNWLFSNHAKNIDVNKEKIKNVVKPLSGMVNEVVKDLEHVANDISIDLKHLSEENFRLNVNNNNLQQEVDTLSKQVLTIDDIKDKLNLTETKLETTEKDFESIKIELNNTVEELKDTKVSMGAEVERLRKVGETLRTLSSTMSNIAIADKDKRDKFLEKLELFLQDTTASFDVCVNKLSNTTNNLEDGAIEIKKVLARSEEQMARYDNHINRLGKLGFFSKDTETVISSETAENKP